MSKVCRIPVARLAARTKQRSVQSHLPFFPEAQFHGVVGMRAVKCHAIIHPGAVLKIPAGKIVRSRNDSYVTIAARVCTISETFDSTSSRVLCRLYACMLTLSVTGTRWLVPIGTCVLPLGCLADSNDPPPLPPTLSPAYLVSLFIPSSAYGDPILLTYF